MNTSKIYREHIEELTRRARDDDFCLKTIFIIALLSEGWRYTPEKPDENVVDLKRYKAKMTAIRQNTHSKNR